MTANGKTYSATTDATGAYTIADLPAGTFAVKASHSDASYIAQEGTVTLANNETAIWEGLLMKASTDVKVETVDPVSKESVDAVYTTTLPNLTDNAQAETSTAYVIVTDKEETFDDPTDEIEMSVYEKIEEEATRAATNMKYSVVLTTSSKKGATSTKKPIRMASDKYGKPSKVLFNGKEVKTTTVGEYTYFDTQEFGTTKFIYGIKVTSSMSTETLTFNPSTFQGPLTSISTNYNYKTGISVSGNNALSQVVALILGGNSKIHTKSATLTQDKKVPNGSVVVVSGYQTINNYTPDDEGVKRKYDSFSYYLNITPFRWVEAAYTCVLYKYNQPDRKGYLAKDRHFALKLNPLYEGTYHPSIAIGADDFLDSRLDAETIQGHFANYWISACKHLTFRGHELTTHLGYRYYLKSWNKKYQGINAALT